MTMRTSVFKRGAAFGTGLVLAGFLTACSGSGQSSGGSEEQPQGAPPKTESAISNPKDAAAVELCDLLPSDAATSLGLNPTGEIDDGPKIQSDMPDSCVWKGSEGNGLSVSLGVLNDRSIQEYHDSKATFSDFQGLQIANHPAVRANQGDPMQDGFCATFVGTKDGQVLGSFTAAPPLEVGEFDPCTTAQKALEASVSALPAAE